VATRKQPKLIRRACGTMGAHMLLLERYPAFRARQQRLENETNRRRTLGFTAAEIKLAKIKVVVNVVYEEPSQNISDAQINSQIKVLNLDFRAKNSDKKKHRRCGTDWSPTLKLSSCFTKSRAPKQHNHLSEPMTRSNALRLAA